MSVPGCRCGSRHGRSPDAVFLPVDAEAYTEVSGVVMDTLRKLDVVVEVMGWDEAFLGVETDDPEAFARTVHDAVLDATGLHCSVGIGDNKLRAKIATDFGKPQGIYRLTEENWFAVMGQRPTDALWGIGRKTAKKLAALGISTVQKLADASDLELAATLGPNMGPWYARIGRGIDLSPVSAEPGWPGRTAGRRPSSRTSPAGRPSPRRSVVSPPGSGRTSSRRTAGRCEWR